MQCSSPPTGDVLALFLFTYGRAEEVKSIRDNAGMEYFFVCLKMKGFREILDTIIHEGRRMMVVVNGLWSHCWLCRQLGYLAQDCQQKRAENPKTKSTKKSPELETLNPGNKQER